MTYQKLREQLDPNRPAIFYMATQPQQYPLAVAGLKGHRLLQPDDTFILEKPLATSKTVAEALLKTFSVELENAGLVEHFNLKLVLGDTPIHFRANTPFDSWFNANAVKEIRIYALEKITVPSERVQFIDNVGSQLRDLITHLSAMAIPLLVDVPPEGLDAMSIRRQKEKIAQSLRVVDADKEVWGQYEGYPTATTSTFTAFTLECDNLRWKGTKIKVVTGKGLPAKYCASEVFFENGLRLLFRHYPNEGIILGGVPIKEPSLSGSSLVPVQMEFTYESAFKDMVNTSAYLRLLYHILNGDNSSFASPVEALEALRIADELEGSNHDFVKYPVGSYPVEAKDWLPSEVEWL